MKRILLVATCLLLAVSVFAGPLQQKHKSVVKKRVAGGATQPTPKAQWSLDNGALTTDSVGSNTLTDQGTVTADTGDYQEGDASGAFQGSGPDYMDIADGSLDSGYPLKTGDTNLKISVTFWWKPDTSLTTQYLYAKHVSTGNLRSFVVKMNTDNTITTHIGYSSGTAFESSTASAAITDDQWYHIGVTFQDSDGAYRMRIWDDTAGDLLAADVTGTFTNSVSLTTADVSLCAQGNGSTPCDGKIDNVKVYDVILTPTQIDYDRNET